MLGRMRRVAVGLWAVCAIGCPVRTPIGELQSDVGATGSGSVGSGSTTEVEPGTSTTELGTTALTDSSDASTTDGAVAPEMTAFAIRWGNIPEDDDGDTDTAMSEVGTGPSQDPDALLVVVGFTTARCEDVFHIEPCSTWNASFTLAPDQQMAGTFDGSTINATFSEIGPGDDPNDCAGFGGGTLETTVVVESIDESGLQIRFEAVDGFLQAFDLEGFSTFAPRC